MAGAGIKNTIMFLGKNRITRQRLRMTNERAMSKLVDLVDEDGPRLQPVLHDDHDPVRCWVPHPRSGIYFPKGQERVMEDIPDEAASLDQTIWLRNVDGVEDVDKPDFMTEAILHNPN